MKDAGVEEYDKWYKATYPQLVARIYEVSWRSRYGSYRGSSVHDNFENAKTEADRLFETTTAYAVRVGTIEIWDKAPGFYVGPHYERFRPSDGDCEVGEKSDDA